MKPGVLSNIPQRCFPSFVPRNYCVFLQDIFKAFPFSEFYFVLFKTDKQKVSNIRNNTVRSIRTVEFCSILSFLENYCQRRIVVVCAFILQALSLSLSLSLSFSQHQPTLILQILLYCSSELIPFSRLAQHHTARLLIGFPCIVCYRIRKNEIRAFLETGLEKEHDKYNVRKKKK